MSASWEVIVGVCAGLATIIGTSAYFVSAAKKLNKSIENVQEGVKCMLRASMLNTYYKNNETDQLKEYEAQNFELQYAAYKTLGGNSFIDKIHHDIQDWDIVR